MKAIVTLTRTETYTVGCVESLEEAEAVARDLWALENDDPEVVDITDVDDNVAMGGNA